MYLLIVFWLNGASSITLAQYESFANAAACEQRLTDTLNREVTRMIRDRDHNLPFMRCVKV